jgi:ADP-ribose pyrophosphatase
MKNKWQTTSSSVVFTGKRFDVVWDTFLLPDGSDGHYEYIKNRNAVMVIPINDNMSFWMVKQYRYLCNSLSLEFPSGACEPDESPSACARRELAEEVGFKAQQLNRLAVLYVAKGFSTQKIYIYAASKLKVVDKKLDNTEVGMKSQLLTQNKFDKLLAENKISDSLTVGAYAVFMSQKSGCR